MEGEAAGGNLQVEYKPLLMFCGQYPENKSLCISYESLFLTMFSCLYEITDVNISNDDAFVWCHFTNLVPVLIRFLVAEIKLKLIETI